MLAPRLRFVLALLAAATTVAKAAPADDMRVLLDQGKAREAYELGRQHQQLLGNPAFDFHFGIAAIEAGRLGEGILSIERYLLSFPENVSARLMVARGYFALGENARAREEFESLLRSSPPADVAAAIERYLDAIRSRESRYATSAGAFFEVGMGHDSNVNSGVNSANVTLPGLGPVILGTTGQKISSALLSVAAGVHVTHPIAPGIALFASGAGDQRIYDRSIATQFEQGNLGASAGATFLREDNLFRITASYGVMTVDSSRYRSVTGIGGEWQRQLTERNALTLGLQAAQLDHADPNSPRDADFYGLNAGYRLIFGHAWQPTLSVGLSYGKQHSRTSRPDLVPRTWGLNSGLSITPAPKWGASVGYQFQQSDYQGPDLFLGETRVDRYHALTANLAYYYSRSLSLRAEAQVIRNRSNIQLYDFPREMAALKVRYEFK